MCFDAQQVVYMHALDGIVWCAAQGMNCMVSAMWSGWYPIYAAQVMLDKCIQIKSSTTLYYIAVHIYAHPIDNSDTYDSKRRWIVDISMGLDFSLGMGTRM